MSRETGKSGLAARRSYTLLERLRADDLDQRLPGVDAVSARVESIQGSLLRLLNSRTGFSQSTAAYGLDDFNDASVGSSDMMRVIAKDIERTIRQFEPRVEQVAVSFDRTQKGGLELSFQVSVKTWINHRAEQVLIDLALTQGRGFRLR